MNTTYSTLYTSLLHVIKKPRISPLSLAVLTSSMVCLPATAAENGLNEQDNLPTATFPKMTVTATRTETAVNNTIAQTRVIDSEELKRYQGQTVLDVLKNQSGINITQSGGMGTSSNFYMRGFDSRQVLVLIDGVRYGSITLGQPALNLLPAEQIERVEILYGSSGSSIYGSDAMGGVIQIFTKCSTGIDQTQFSVTAGFGSNDQYLYGASAQISNEQGTSFSVSASHNETDGINAIKSGLGFQPDSDGFESNNASIALHQKFNNNFAAGITALYSDSTSDFDSADGWTGSKALDDVYVDQENGAANAYIEYNDGKNNAKLSYGYSIDESSNYQYENNIGNPSYFDINQQSIRLENISNIGSFTDLNKDLGQLVYGLEYLKQSVDSSQKYDKDNRDITSGFVGYNFDSDKYTLQSNFRIDDNSQYGRNTTYNIGAAIKPTDSLSVGANYANGFRAPTFNDLYWPGYGNPNLKPETSKTAEVFIEYAGDSQRTRITGYKTDADNLITSGRNIGNAKIEGLSLTSDWVYDSLLFGLGYDYLKAEDDTKGSNTYGKQLDHRPENSGLIYIGYQEPKFDVRLEAKYNDERNSDSAKIKLDDYTLVNLAGNYRFTPNVTGSLRVENITDEDYTLSNQYGTEYATEGTNYYGSLTYTWK